jgi:hypothetical protein
MPEKKVPWGLVAGIGGLAAVGIGGYLVYKGVSDFAGKFNDLMGNAGKAISNAGAALAAAGGAAHDAITKPVDKWWIESHASATSELKNPALYKKTTVTTLTPAEIEKSNAAQPKTSMSTLVTQALADLEEMDNWLPATAYKNKETWRDARTRVYNALKTAPGDPTTINNAAFFIQDVKKKFPTHYAKAGCAYKAGQLYGMVMAEIVALERSGNPAYFGALADLHEAAGYCQQAIALCEGR